MNALQVLRKARKLIETPERWTKGDAAKDRDGVPVGMKSRAAVCFCAAGAIARASGGWNGGYHNARAALEVAIGGAIAEWNDAPRRTHAQVLRAFDKAITSLEKPTNPEPPHERHRPPPRRP